MVKYVNYGHPKHGIHIYVITIFRTDYGNYKVEVLPCDNHGISVSDPAAWDIFPSWWSAYKYAHKQYEEFYRYVNERS